MPITPTYPGVYIEEIKSGVRTITGVATSITAFIGRTLQGPVNEPTLINSYSDFERIFGGLWIKSTLGFAVRDFYQNGGSQAIIVRLLHPNFATEGQEVKALEAAKAVANVAKGAANGAAAKAAAKAKANEYESKEPEENVAAQAVLNAIDTLADGASSSDIEKAVNDAVNQAVARKALLSLGEASNRLTLAAVSAGAWANSLRARVDRDVPKNDELPQSYKSFGISSSDVFNLTVRDINSGTTEVFRNVTVKPSPRQVKKVLENESQLVRVMEFSATEIPEATDARLEQTRQNASEEEKKILSRIQPFDREDITRSLRSIGVDDTNRGTDGSEELDVNDFVGIGLEANKKGLYGLLKTDIFNLLCIPPYKDDGVDTNLLEQAAQFCQEHRAFLIIDSPPNKTKDSIKDWVNGLTRNNYAAVFFPRLKTPNPLRDNQIEEFAPCGVVAGIFARTDAQRGIWKAPAGLEANLVGVPELSVPLTNDENGELNQLGINCLRSFPVNGRVIWGSRTLRGADQLADEYKYIPVRRLALYIEESLYRGTQWIVFEPNDEPLWAQIRLNIGAFMNNLFRQGAFQGRTPQEAYFVKCSSETTTQNDINLGIVNILVGFAPLKPAEFVVIKIQQIAGQIAT
ncbi:phage tail sheath protein [Scytonema hofmannii PCC 7110]|uniref:Phage tail sheath protein n=1 Tax=Scytonema hofmannii PCC 7110 TaxID=128403 RepID=A0A139WY22_9CYAN|nr:phage tail sheath subtilisin-like domain-containing protein [Scytonema hofmannii]KYC37282.1 phage tail sheath protein [Scytonema hofmannii PCC 7110]